MAAVEIDDSGQYLYKEKVRKLTNEKVNFVYNSRIKFILFLL